MDLAAELPEVADEPIGDSSLIPTLLVSRLARQSVKVALSADGADELFGGYARYGYCGDFVESRSRMMRGIYFLAAEMIDQMPPAFVAGAYAMAKGGGPRFAAINDKLRKFVRMSRAKDAFTAYEAAISEWSAAEVQRLAKLPACLDDSRRAFESVVYADLRDRFMHFDTARYLPGDLLVKIDRASMFVSLEAREPFLDHDLARLAAALPLQWKIRDGKGKYILRRLLERYFPADFFDRPKQGFSAPVGDWLRGPLRPMFLENLSPARLREFGLLDPAATTVAVNAFLGQGRGSGSPAGAWILLQLQQWAGRWLKAPSRRLNADRSPLEAPSSQGYGVQA